MIIVAGAAVDNTYRILLLFGAFVLGLFLGFRFTLVQLYVGITTYFLHMNQRRAVSLDRYG